MLKFALPFILISFVLMGLLYDFYVPLFEKPDELKHFAVIQYIHQYHALPVVEAGVYTPWDQEGTQPPLYHLTAATLTAWLDLSDFSEPPRNPHYVDERSFIWRERGNNNLYLHPPDENYHLTPSLMAARLARWFSLLCGLITLSLTHALAQHVLNRSDQALLATAGVAFLPQFLHTSTAITNDSLSTTLAVATLWLLARRLHTPTRANLMGLGLLLGLGAITKLSLLYLLPLVGLALSYHYARQGQFKAIITDGLALAGGVILVAGGWYARNQYLYGDPTALNAHLLYRGGPLTPTPSLAEIYQTELTGLELSFWAAFGAGQILWEAELYQILSYVKYLTLLGVIIGLLRPQPQLNRPLLAWLSLWGVIIFMALLRWMQITPASWGRLLFPALPAGAIITVWALSQLQLKRLPLPDTLFPAILVTSLFSLALISPFRYLQTTYHPAPFIITPPATMQPLNVTYANALRLIGYEVEPTPVKPGEWLPVTLYWQATRPITQNYSIFIHLLAPQKIGQVNTYPHHGNWPTRFLPPGAILADTSYIPIDPTAPAPAAMQLAIGLFDFNDPQRAALPAVNAQGQPVSPLIGSIPLIPTSWPALTPTHATNFIFGNQIALIGYDTITPSLRVGATLPLTLYWQGLNSPQQDLTLFIQLVNAQRQVAGFDAPPAFPTRFWSAETRLIDPRSLTLPPDLPPGDYQILLGWYDPHTGARLPLPAYPQAALPLLNLTLTP